LYPDGPAEFALRIEADRPVDGVYLAVNLADRFDTRLVNCDSHRLPDPIDLRPGVNELRVRIESLHLNPGHYQLGLWMADAGDTLDSVPDAAEVEVGDYSPDPELMSLYHSGAVTNRFTITRG
jgi:hypothetical protein